MFVLQELSDQMGGDFDNNDVRWVITVPAIWKMPAKQFMREAAYKVGREALVTPQYEAHSFFANVRFHVLEEIITSLSKWM